MHTFPALSDPTYRIEAELGAGGGGVVYKAWHSRLEKHVVLKRIKDESGLLRTGRERAETDILKNLKHAYLPQLYDFITDSSGVYTVMEFIPGKSFADLLKEGQKFTQQQVVRWAEQLSDALAYLHGQDPPVLHSDIKPGNIMLTENGDVCLIDFNISLVLDGIDAGALGLSHGYASPEQYGPQELPRDMQISVNSESVFPYAKDDAQNETVVEEYNGDETELLSAETELAEVEASPIGDETELLPEPPGFDAPQPHQLAHGRDNGDFDIERKGQSTNPESSSAHRRLKIRMDTRSDIYSFGAILYHLLTGEKPAISTGEIKPIRDFGIPFSEGIAYIVERCMERDPQKRFQTAAELHGAVLNIHKHDTRWRISRAKRIAAAIILPVAFALFAATALFGVDVMAQEKEERYYTAVYDIENSTDPQGAYDAAISMFWDRIDPYHAMAKRLWNDGDIDVCKAFIEQNLGNVAQFQSIPEAARSFGDIYFILGNCYYYRSDEPDYNMAKGNFEIAVRFVEDNPVYYRDYAISLARTGDIDDAEQALEKARSLGLETDSLSLLGGEISFAKREYDSAIDSFGQVISLTNDDYLRYRAYHTSDEIFKLLGEPRRSAALLSDALSKVPPSRVREITERLADAYVKSGDYRSAIRVFEQLTESGAPQFHIMQGLAILLQNTGELDRAEAVLNQMSDIFPNEYRVPMRRAYLEADRQSKIANEDRDYAPTKEYYDAATALYRENVRPGESDPEMQQLDLLIEQLRSNGWID